MLVGDLNSNITEMEVNRRYELISENHSDVGLKDMSSYFLICRTPRSQDVLTWSMLRQRRVAQYWME